MVDAAFTCACGIVRGKILNATPKGGNHCVCYCESCRAGALYAGDRDPVRSGVELFQTTADRIVIQDGLL
ncbi:MAG: hypothetical protein WBB25_12685 [Sulfitobacter sp.]